MSTSRLQSGEFLSSLTEILSQCLRSAGVDSKIAAEIENKSSALIRENFAGATVYIAHGRVDSGESAAEVYALRMDGLTPKEIAARRSITPQYVYKLLAKEEARLKVLRDARKKSPKLEN